MQTKGSQAIQKTDLRLSAVNAAYELIKSIDEEYGKLIQEGGKSPLAFAFDVMNDQNEDTKVRLAASKILMSFKQSADDAKIRVALAAASVNENNNSERIQISYNADPAPEEESDNQSD